jgi:hypothetical protein
MMRETTAITQRNKQTTYKTRTKEQKSITSKEKQQQNTKTQEHTDTDTDTDRHRHTHTQTCMIWGCWYRVYPTTHHYDRRK